MGKLQEWKIQKPLFTTGDAMFLVYNSRRTQEFQMPVTKEILALFKGDLKIYVLGKLVNERFEIGEVLKNRNW